MLLRRLLGDALRGHRQGQSRTLRDVAGAARVSLAYLSEVERGVKEPSSELLAAICTALGVPLSQLLREAGERSMAEERVTTLVQPATQPAERSPAAERSPEEARRPVASVRAAA